MNTGMILLSEDSIDLADILEEILEPISDFISDFIFDLFDFLNFRMLGEWFWNTGMKLIGGVASSTPETFSSSTWSFVTGDVLDFTMFVGSTLLNAFFMVSIIRQTTNFKESFTLEILIDNVIKMILANGLILNGLDLMKLLFSIAGDTSSVFLDMSNTSISISDRENFDLGNVLFDFLLGGIVFCIVSIVCTITIFLTVYQRYIQLYLLVATYPIAFATIPGGHGVSNTASAWVRTFLSKTFEIVIIAISISIAVKMCNSIDFGTFQDTVGSNFNGAIQSLQAMATMIFITAFVKGADAFMRRTFNL